jgi:hypothetical protein
MCYTHPMGHRNILLPLRDGDRTSFRKVLQKSPPPKKKSSNDSFGLVLKEYKFLELYTYSLRHVEILKTARRARKFN